MGKRDVDAAVDARRRLDKPFFWRVANGVHYAEMVLSPSIRPPLLTEWESERVQAFRNRERRTRWLAGRALAKVLVKERLDLPGIVEIREGADGEPLVFSNGFPMPEVWLGISVRHDRVSCVIADRPIGLEVRKAETAEADVVDNFIARGEQRTLRKALGSPESARSAAWAIKEAAQRAVRCHSAGNELREVEIDSQFGVHVGDEAQLNVMALRVVDEIAVAIVGRFRLEERHSVRIVLDEAAREQATPKLQSAIERSVAKAKRIAEAKLRWQASRTQATEG